MDIPTRNSNHPLPHRFAPRPRLSQVHALSLVPASFSIVSFRCTAAPLHRCTALNRTQTQPEQHIATAPTALAPVHPTLFQVLSSLLCSAFCIQRSASHPARRSSYSSSALRPDSRSNLFLSGSWFHLSALCTARLVNIHLASRPCQPSPIPTLASFLRFLFIAALDAHFDHLRSKRAILHHRPARTTRLRRQ